MYGGLIYMLGGNMDNLVGGSRKKRLGDLLVDAGVITQDQLMQALQIQKTEKKDIVSVSY